MPRVTKPRAGTIATPLDQEFNAILYDALLQDEEEKKLKRIASGKTGRDMIRASEFGTVSGKDACWRKLFYDFHDAPKDPSTPDSLLNFKIGDSVHWMLQNLLARHGYVEKIEFQNLDFSPFPVSGRLDILTDPKARRVVDIKTTTRKAVGYLPKPDATDQVNIYLWALRRLPEYAGYTGTVLYVVKDAAKGQPVAYPFPAPYDPKRALEILSEATKARRTATGDVLPDRPDGFSPTEYPCGYCSFKGHCWSGKEALVS